MFTEEASLKRALRGELSGNFHPKSFPIELLDDKWALAEWLQATFGLTCGLEQWPLEEDGKNRFPCLVKAKHSWKGPSKLPRGWICHSPEEFSESLAAIHNHGFSLGDFFVQEWLGTSNCRVISVCGFHDWSYHKRNLIAIVERTFPQNVGLGNSAAVEAIRDDWALRERTFAILDALEYKGPYELEFLIAGDRVAVLELNPRFWMQHSIFFSHGNGLIKRYLGLDTDHDRQQQTVEGFVWVNGLRLMSSIILMRWAFPFFVLRKVLSGRSKVLIMPSLLMAMFVLFRGWWLRLV